MEVDVLWTKVVENMLKTQQLTPFYTEVIKKIIPKSFDNNHLDLFIYDTYAKRRIESDISSNISNELENILGYPVSFAIKSDPNNRSDLTASFSSYKTKTQPITSANQNNYTINQIKENNISDQTAPTISTIVTNGKSKNTNNKNFFKLDEYTNYKSPADLNNQSNLLNQPKPLFGRLTPDNSKVMAGYTFENFVAGDANSFVLSACMAVSDKPGLNYNPLLIHGKSGMGKTHLLHAIGNSYKIKFNEKGVLYCTAQEFINDYVFAIREGQMHNFKIKYSNIDLLLIDDMQFFASKTSSQEQFVYVFNQLVEAGKQVVMTSDVHPNDLKNLPERLKTRMKNTIVGLVSVGLETKIAILKVFSNTAGQSVATDVLEVIAQKSTGSVRELIGLYRTVINYLIFSGKNVTPEEAYNYLVSQNVAPVVDEHKAYSPQSIVKNICDFYNSGYEEIIGASRRKSVVFTRNLCVFVLRKITNLSLTEVGEQLGGRDHSTILNCYNKAEKIISQDNTIFEQIRIFLNISRSQQLG
ncbi:MAG: chromosomal replication initiator protein DnaA [Bifidobacteriaceae bacterium]|jgi:chromosomal replication initiator protein|nr:chromosomal replication initiator protein DnaA [Bifidobacteriaceae bacterium]